MKLLLVLLCSALASCASPAIVTPRADLAPIKASNAATRTAIKSTRTKIESAQKSSEKGSDSLKEAKAILEGLLR